MRKESTLPKPRSAMQVRSLREQARSYSFRSTVDSINRRLIVHECSWTELTPLIREWFAICRRRELGKLIVQAREEQWQNFLQMGFRLEGVVPSFFQGQPVYYMCKYFNEERQASSSWPEEEQILEQVLVQQAPAKDKELPEPFRLAVADEKDIDGLVDLYRKVFDSYPSPLTDPEYLAESMQHNVFVVVRDGENIVSGAGAEIDWDARHAEMTNCATLPDYRRYGLMGHQFDRLEQELKKLRIFSLYSIARAKSFGMNRVLHRRGYRYRGRLVNNCDICGGLEDMNLWSKQLVVSGEKREGR